MNDDPIFRTWHDATNCWLAGAGLPPLKTAAEQVSSAVKSGNDVSVTSPEPAPAAVPKPVPQIWTAMGCEVLKRDEFFCWCENVENAWFIADRLNAFDANLAERNMFQRMYLHSKEEGDE